MKRNFFRNELLAGLLLVAMGGGVTTAFADGTETLGPPSIPIAEGGTGIVAAGVGLADAQAGTINIDVPGEVVQVLLYWAGAATDANPADDVITVNGVEITGTEIGGPAFFFTAFGKDFYYSNFRADITSLGFVSLGDNTLTVGGLDNIDAGGNGENSGAGVLVIFDDGSDTADIQVRDGLDLAFAGFPDPRRDTIPQTFAFITPADFDRTAELIVFAGSVGQEGNRTNIIKLTTDGLAGGTEDLDNQLASVDGNLWDTLSIPVDIPAGATMLTVKIESGDGTGNPASLNWIGAGLSVEVEPPAPSGITRTLGYWKGHPTVIDGSFDGPGGFPSLLPLSFCGEAIVESCDAVAFLQSKGGGINNFKRQGMAALLNCQAFGCASEISDLIEDGSEACATGASFDFGGAGDVLDLFNKSGDNLNLPFQSPSAQPKFCE